MDENKKEERDALVDALRDRIAELENEALHPRVQGEPLTLDALKAVAAARAAQLLKWPVDHDAKHDAGEWLAILTIPTRQLALASLDKDPARAAAALAQIGAVAVAGLEALSRREAAAAPQLDALVVKCEVVREGSLSKVSFEVEIDGEITSDVAARVAQASKATLDKFGSGNGH